MKNFLIFVLAVLALGLGYLAYDAKTSPAEPDNSAAVAKAVESNIVGKWQSLDDQKFMRIFNNDGTIIDTYEGEAEPAGKWGTYTKNNAPKTDFPLEGNVSYIHTVFPGESEELTLNFKVEKLTPETLELTYMERGNILRFSKAQ